jgi:predicted dehydrogenase
MNAPKSPSSPALAVGIVGAGYIADYHVSALRAVPGVEVRAVCDLRGSAAARFAEAQGIPASYGDLAEMLRSEKLDAIHVLTPPNAHVAPALQILDAGVDVLLEKPLAHTLAGCEALESAARQSGARCGTSHNFLFTKPYERLMADVSSGRLGHLDQIDIVWNKELGQVKGGPFSAFMLAHPSHILFEVAPHSFAHALHLTSGLAPNTSATEITDLSVDARDEVALPRGLRFFRRWEIRGWAGKTSVRIRFCFDAGYPEHYVHVRGSNGTGHVDFENNTYVRQEHTPYLLDIDRFVNVGHAAQSALTQAGATLGQVVLAKAGLPVAGGPFAESITRAVRCFYDTRLGKLDPRLDVALAKGAVALATRAAERAGLGQGTQAPAVSAAPKTAAPHATGTLRPDTLVVGGTGFIGRALVRRLVESGVSVRVLARDPDGAPPELMRPEVERVRGDFTDLASVVPALEGIKHVYHLARGYGNTWDEYLRWDVAPTRAFAEACAKSGVERFFYASSIAIYYAGARAGVITEDTAPVDSMLRANALRAQQGRERACAHRADAHPRPAAHAVPPGHRAGRGRPAAALGHRGLAVSLRVPALRQRRPPAAHRAGGRRGRRHGGRAHRQGRAGAVVQSDGRPVHHRQPVPGRGGEERGRHHSARAGLRAAGLRDGAVQVRGEGRRAQPRRRAAQLRRLRGQELRGHVQRCEGRARAGLEAREAPRGAGERGHPPARARVLRAGRHERYVRIR